MFNVGDVVRRINSDYGTLTVGTIVIVATTNRGMETLTVIGHDDEYDAENFELVTPTDDLTPVSDITPLFKQGDMVRMVSNTAGGPLDWLGKLLTIKLISIAQDGYTSPAHRLKYYMEDGRYFLYEQDIEAVDVPKLLKPISTNFREYILNKTANEAVKNQPV